MEPALTPGSRENMREINAAKIRDAVSELCLKANFELRKDILRALKAGLKKETAERTRSILGTIIENARIARSKKLAICQDTGMAYVHIDVGQQAAIVGGSLRKAVNDGVKEAYIKGYLRKSVVSDPFIRENTKTNEPAILVTDIVDGDRMAIDVSPKGFGSENKSRIKMFKPTASIGEIKEFVLDVVRRRARSLSAARPRHRHRRDIRDGRGTGQESASQTY